MKTLISLVLAFLLPLQSFAYCVKNKKDGKEYNSKRVAHLTGEIPSQAGDIRKNPVIKLGKEMEATLKEPGDRILIITSPGGDVRVGQEVLNALLFERASRNAKLICIVKDYAHSMAFNILSHCDIRLAFPNSKLLAHKIHMNGPDSRMTARNMRYWADELERDDEPYRQQNAKALRMSVKDYDKYADAEYIWSSKELVDRGYLDGEATECD